MTTFRFQTDRDQKQIGVQSARQINCNYPADLPSGKWQMGNGKWEYAKSTRGVDAKCKTLSNSAPVRSCFAPQWATSSIRKLAKQIAEREHKWDTLFAWLYFWLCASLCFSPSDTANTKKQTTTTSRKVGGKIRQQQQARPGGKGLLHFSAESESNFRSLNLHFEIKFFTLEKFAASNIFILPQTRRNYALSVGTGGWLRWQPPAQLARNQEAGNRATPRSKPIASESS